MNSLIETSLNGKGDSDAHLTTMFGIALSIRAKNILELGVRDGTTTLPLLMAAKMTGGKVVSVDINDTVFVPPPDLAPYWSFVKMDALEYLKQLDKSVVQNLIYVDDWHSYEHVKAELGEIDKCVSPSSIVLLHDLMYGNYTPRYHSDLTENAGAQWARGGPYRAVAELPGQFWEFSTIPVCNGLTILRKKYSNKYHI
jgi:cephalosporin hydroxylase